MRPGGIAVSPTLDDIERLVLLHSDQLVRLQVSLVQTLGVEMSVVKVDTDGVVVVVGAAQTLVQSGAPVVVEAAEAVQTEPTTTAIW